MSRQAWGEGIFWVTAPETPVVNSVAETRLYSDVVIPAGYMSDGRILRLKVQGSIKSTVASTMKLTLKLDTAILAAATAQPTPASPLVKCWSAEFIVQTLSNGRNGTLLAFGDAAIALDRQVFSKVGSVDPASVTKDLLVETVLGVFATWGNADAGNSILGMTYILESLN